MENLKEKNENKDSVINNGIKPERLKALKGKYQKPEISSFDFNKKIEGISSDITIAYMCTSSC